MALGQPADLPAFLEPVGPYGRPARGITGRNDFMNLMRILLLFSVALLACPLTNAQRAITGIVTDANTGELMPGVTVAIQGTDTGTVTNADGRFELNPVSESVTLIFRFVGYRTLTLDVPPDASPLTVRLRESVLGLNEMVVVGTRRLPRMVKDSVVPVDVLGPSDLANVATTDMDDILRTHVPSYNVGNSGGDEAALVRPATMRGLPTDNVVVLINGKRRHRSSSIALSGSALNKGAQGPDLNTIPSIAVKQIEILRDGASAQYGADAVAGVLNLRLRDSVRGLVVRMQGGQYTHGDGRYGHLAANVGLPLTEHGYLNLSLEGRDVGPTGRSAQRADAALLASRGYPVKNPAHIWGSPEVRDSWTGFANAGLLIGNTMRAYTFGGFAQRTAEYGFYFRAPGTATARGSVFRFGTGESARRAVIDLDPSDEVVCRDLEDLPGLDADNAAVQGFVGNYRGRCFLFNELFPGGFTPQFGADMTDWSMVAGVEGGPDAGLKWDVNLNIGRSVQDYFIYDTINASYGPNTPTSFKPRGYMQQEMEASLAMSYPIPIGALASPLNVAWGFTWRDETFESRAGNLESYHAGPYSDQGFSVGSNGYQGLNPNFAGRWSRPNVAFYLDLEADLSARWVVYAAARYENFYEQFGSTLTGKLGGLFRATNRIAFRGTISTGFRAPTPGQANLNVFQTTGFSPTTGLIEVGQLPSTHPIAQGLGGKQLTEEKSRNVSLGAIMEISEDLTLTFDYFDITFKDRIAVTGNIPMTDEMVAIMDEANLLGGVQNIREIRFYSNDFDTRTRGTDLVLAWQREWSGRESSSASLAWNWTELSLVDFAQPKQLRTFLNRPLQQPVMLTLLTPARQTEMLTLSPKHRTVLTARHEMGSVHAMVRLNYYSSFQICAFGNTLCRLDDGQSALETYRQVIIAGGELGYAIRRNYRAAVGVNNLFDSVPLNSPAEVSRLGQLHPRELPWDYNGRAVYIRLTADLF